VPKIAKMYLRKGLAIDHHNLPPDEDALTKVVRHQPLQIR
jgi:hypothetical protein